MYLANFKINCNRDNISIKIIERFELAEVSDCF